MGARKKITVVRVFTILIILGMIGGVWYVFSTLFSNDVKVPPEKIVQVVKEDITQSVVAVGKIEPEKKVEIKSKASGIVQCFYVDEGDFVKKGRTLLDLDREQLEASLKEASARMLSKKALYEKARADEKYAALALSTAKERAKNKDYIFARREYKRKQTLYAQSLISKEQLDNAEQQYRSALVEHKVLEKEVKLKESQLISAQKAVFQALADYHAEEAALQRAEEALREATIKSPIAGVVLKRYLEVGDAVSSILQLGSNATVIMTVGKIDSLYFKGRIDESDVGQIHIGLPVSITVETFRNKVFRGIVSRIAPMGEEENNVTRFEVRATITGNIKRLRPGMSANAEIVLERKSAVITIPEDALQYDENKRAFVKLIEISGEHQKLRRVFVKPGISNGSRVEIVEGLKEGEKVVLP